MSKVHFIHLRRLSADERGVDVAAKGGVTIAYELNDRKVVKYATARCSDKDHYCKATGRAKAGGRLNSPRFFIELESPMPVEEFHTFVTVSSGDYVA